MHGRSQSQRHFAAERLTTALHTFTAPPQVGEFYEAFGVDALMLVEHAALNPMGQKCRAGCPVQNVQATLNDLTAAGLTVAVYEEIGPANSVKGMYRSLKQRALAQIVSPGSPTYMYEAVLSPHEIAYAEPPPYVGICGSATGYTAVQVSPHPSWP